MANSSRLVLPTTTAPAAREPLDDGGVVRRAPALEDPRRAGRRDAPGAQVVLERDGHAGQRARVLARRRPGGRSSAAAARASSASDEVEGVDLAVALGDARPGAPRPPRRPSARPARTAAAISTARSARHGSSPRIGGTRKRPSSTAGRAGEHLVAVEARRGLRRRAARCAAGAGGRSGGTSARSSASTSRGVVEHRGQLPGERVELVVGQRRAGPAGPRARRRRG